MRLGLRHQASTLLRGFGELGGDAAIEAVPGDDEALMRARADLVDAVMGDDLEARARAPAPRHIRHRP